jgi:hypothetical protein
MWRLLLVMVVACESTPVATPGPAPTPAVRPEPQTPAPPPPPPKVTTPHATCIRESVDLEVAGGKPILCWDDGCLAYEAGKTPQAVARPARVMFHPEAEVRDDRGHRAACNAAGCDPLGPKLDKLIADILAFEAAEKPGDGRDGPLLPMVTRDRALVYLANTHMGEHLWNVHDDASFEPQQPASLGRFAVVRLMSAEPVGDELLLMWGACRTKDALGGCGMDEVYRTSFMDTKGHDLDGDHEEVGTVVPIAKDRYVAYGDAVLVIEHGKVVASRAFKVAGSSYSSAPGTQIERLDDDHVAMLFHGSAGWRLLVVALTKGLPEVELARPPECSI